METNRNTDKKMDGWMDGWVDGWMDGWMDGRAERMCIYRCHRRNGPNFGRVFLKLNYTDITQNTYIQS